LDIDGLQIKQSAGFKESRALSKRCMQHRDRERPTRLMATGVPCRRATVSPYANDKGEAVPTVAAIDERE
jgi:hypothetical protein